MFKDALFIHYGYHGEDVAPSLTLHTDSADTFTHFEPRGQLFTLNVDTNQRFCTGWHDLATSQSFPCPDAASLPAQFDTCRHCQNKTGFNPAFYHASSISPQQEARNQQPHFLYLAHFGPGVVKVGISWAERGLRRLLDQGARSCLVIKTYPTANIARQYEAKSAKLPGIAETLQVKTKLKLLGQTYDAKAAADELLAARQRLITEAGVVADDSSPLYLDEFYTDTPIDHPTAVDVPKISGQCSGMVGCVLIMEQNNRQYGLPLSNFTGYHLHITPGQEVIQTAPQQASLF